MITTKQIYNNIINFKNSPRTLKWEWGYWIQTLRRWRIEGLPCMKSLNPELNAADSIDGLLEDPYREDLADATPSNKCLNKFFDLDKGCLFLRYRYFYFPIFIEKIIHEDEKYIIKYNDLGIKVKILKNSGSMPMWLEYPVHDRESWERLKQQRLNIETVPMRFYGNIKDFLKSDQNNKFPIIMDFGYGFFGGLRFLMGEDRLFLTYYDDPALIKDINNHLLKLMMAISEELTSRIDFDAVYFWEDMSGKNGSLISPGAFKEFMTPYYKKIISFLKSKGLKKFAVDTDGNVEKLIPLFLEAGVNMMFPFERQAGNDLIEYRKNYPKLVMMGGFNKNTLSLGKESIDKEFEKIRWLISRGGYIPFCDHVVPPNVSLENFKYYRNKLNRIIDSTKINIF